MSVIQQVKNVMSGAILRFSDEFQNSPKSVQLLIYSEDLEGNPSYKVLNQYKPIKKITFNEILGVKIDFLMREAIATPFLKNAIVRLSKEIGATTKDVNIMIQSADEKAENLLLHLYNDKKFVKQISFAHIFGEED